MMKTLVRGMLTLVLMLGIGAGLGVGLVQAIALEASVAKTR